MEKILRAWCCLNYRPPAVGSKLPALNCEWQFPRLDSWEMPAVRWHVETARRPALRGTAIALNHLSNGWLYLFLTILVLILQGWAAWHVIWLALLSLVIAHSVYPFIKSYIARPRPIDRDPTLTSLVNPFDAYSCPSGHCMTAVAVFIPIGFGLSTTVLPLAILALLIAWARLAAAHHYPTDLISGVVLGTSIAVPICWAFPY